MNSQSNSKDFWNAIKNTNMKWASNKNSNVSNPNEANDYFG